MFCLLNHEFSAKFFFFSAKSFFLPWSKREVCQFYLKITFQYYLPEVNRFEIEKKNTFKNMSDSGSC